jgi:hypothetical protein
MNKKIILGAFITIGLTALLIIVGFNKKISGTPVEVYQVYLDGKKMGLISSKNELLDLIDKEQSAIKEEYGVDRKTLPMIQYRRKCFPQGRQDIFPAH